MTRLSRREFTASIVGAAVASTRVGGAASAQTDGRQAPRTSVRGGADALAALTLAEASARLRAGTVTSTDLVERVPRADRRLQPEGQRVHHGHARRGAGAGQGARRRTARRQAARSAARHPDRAEGQHRYRRYAHHRGERGLRRSRAGRGRRGRRAAWRPPARSSSARPTSTSSRSAARRRRATTGRCATRGRSSAIPADRPADRRPRSRPTSATARSAPTPAAPSARPPPTAASSG